MKQTWPVLVLLLLTSCSSGFAQKQQSSVQTAQATETDAEISELRRLLETGNAVERQQSAQALGRIGEPAKSAIPTLVTGLQDEAATVRIESAAALGFIGQSAGSARMDLGHSLNDQEVRVAIASALAIARIGPDSASTTVPPRLIEALAQALFSDRDWRLNDNAALALIRLDPASASVQEIMRRGLNSENGVARIAVIRALADTAETDARQTYRSILEAFANEPKRADKRLQREVAKTLKALE